MSVCGCSTQLAIKQRELQLTLHSICPARCVKDGAHNCAAQSCKTHQQESLRRMNNASFSFKIIFVVKIEFVEQKVSRLTFYCARLHGWPNFSGHGGVVTGVPCVHARVCACVCQVERVTSLSELFCHTL